MHIAFCAPITYRAFSQLEGSENLPAEGYGLTTDIAAAYHERGHRVTVVSWSREIRQTAVWKKDSFTLIAVPMRNLSTGLPSLVREMVARIREAQPDVVHAHWLYEFADAALASGVPVLVTAHDAPWRIARLERAPYWWYRAIYAQLRVFTRLRTLSAVAPYTAEAIRRDCRYRRRLEVIPNGIPACHHAARARTRRINSQDIKLISISNWSARKNIPAAIKAFAYIRQEYPTARLILAGNGLGPDQAAHAYAQSQNLHHGIEFKGSLPREQIYALLSDETDICLHTSREECCCMALLESMSLGVPCVAAKGSGGTPWVLDDGRAGVLTDGEDSVAIAHGVLSLLRDDDAYARISETAWNRARTTFSFEQVISRYLEVLAEIAR